MNRLILYGLVGGGIVIAYNILLYFSNKSLLFDPALNWTQLLFYLFIMVGAVRSVKQQTEGSFPLNAALKPAFTVFFIINLCYYAFTYVLFNYVDSSLVDVQKQLFLDNKDLIVKTLGDKYYEELKNADFSFTLTRTFFAFCQALIGGFLLALIIALISRRN